ncbi:hypothetical protein [Desulfovibrio sp. ZJ200]|uniref:DUF1156 domain-containing protein n=1 Tax=Desulfovibrio sp. ZJ200 TaxID=2709792 RepID=UPI001F14F66B|nr:hypothetical protein [Desulfovibrio sp. ZJ200]
MMINKAMIEIPPKFAGNRPVNPETRARMGADRIWKGVTGLAEDVRYYGEWMKQEAFRRIGHLYPKVKLPPEQGGGKATVIAWKWARTVKCPNPACRCEMPLASSFVLSKKKGKEAWIEPHFENGTAHYEVHLGGTPNREGTVNRQGAVCPCCGTTVPFRYIREQGKAGAMSAQMMAVVAEGKKGRIYLSPDNEHRKINQIVKPDTYPQGEMPKNPRWFSPPMFGLNDFSDLFTPRQLTALTTFSNLVAEAQQKATQDAIAAGLADDGKGLAEGGYGATAYGQAVGVYLAFVVDKLSDRNSSICSWDMSRDGLRNTFGRQAIAMVWDYAEGNPFSNSSGCFNNMLEWVFKCLLEFPASIKGTACQHDAQTDYGLRNLVISSDPPYYDNIGYADLSDFFYIWLRQSLKSTCPQLFRTMLVPKTEELVATPYRFDGNKDKARHFFEHGMLEACRQLYTCAREDVPVTIYYAYKQSENDEGSQASTGWETMLSAIINAGFAITGTWPMRTEMANRSVASNTNALASSIVLVCRKRPANAPSCPRRSFMAELKRELRSALKKLQASNIAPVDMAQAAIGPGMGVYSRYAQVLEADGSAMTVRNALHSINQELDAYLAEQDGNLDAASRFCIDLYAQYAFNDMKFGEADVLARAKNTAVGTLADMGLVFAEKGIVHLREREDLPAPTADSEKTLWLLTQQLTHAMQEGGITACARIVARMYGSAPDRAKALAYRLHALAEQKGWTQEAYAYNTLVVAWPEIQQQVSAMREAARHATQATLL